jgi:NADPH-dependent 2,4-dienoyl-CoA reductase/sulfur reductase-like enzyme
MIRIVAAALFTATLLLGAVDAVAADRVQAGLWETTMTIGTAKPVVTKACITAREAQLMNGDVATLRKYLEESTATKTRGRCAVKNVTVTGNQTIATIACGKIEVTGTTTYHGDHYESSSSNGSKLVGRRIGACPAP